MKHPSEYTTVPFGGLRVMVVDAGTTITDERTGDAGTVTDECVVFKGNVIWCTQKIWDAIRAQVQ